MIHSFTRCWETCLLTVSAARQKTRKQMNSQINIAYSNYASAINMVSYFLPQGSAVKIGIVILMRRESELREPEFRILNSLGDWVIIIKHYIPPRRILFSYVPPVRFACEEDKVLLCIFVLIGRIPWVMMSIYVTVFSHRQSDLVAFIFVWMLHWRNNKISSKNPNILTPVFAETCSLTVGKYKFWSWILWYREKKKTQKTLSEPQKVISLLVIYVFCFVSCDRNMVLDMRIKCNILVFKIYIPVQTFPTLSCYNFG